MLLTSFPVKSAYSSIDKKNFFFIHRIIFQIIYFCKFKLFFILLTLTTLFFIFEFSIELSAFILQCTVFDIRKSSGLRLFIMLATIILIYSMSQVNIVSSIQTNWLPTLIREDFVSRFREIIKTNFDDQMYIVWKTRRLVRGEKYLRQTGS